MIVFAREVFVCKCSTDVRRDDPDASDDVRAIRWIRGGDRELALLDPADHDADHMADLRDRLDRGEHWLVGLDGDRVVSYTWLHARSHVTYPYLPGCTFELSPGVGYGYDAWTPADRRGGGLRRRGFLEELFILKTALGCSFEASFFVKHQLEGATRSLGKVGIDIVPLYRVSLAKDRTLEVENLAPSDDSVKPAIA